jgi:hypothetical protein
MTARPLTMAYWERLKRLAEPLELMKFTLFFDDDLPASSNKGKPGDVAKIRNDFHPQLVDLWKSHIALRELERTARWPIIRHEREVSGAEPERIYDLKSAEFQHKDEIPPLEPGQRDLCEPLRGTEGTSNLYRPIVRESLGLACALDIIFLRPEDPGSLVLQGGDLDGRMKTLFDALRMPSKSEEEASGITPVDNPLQVLLESDTLISDLSIKTRRLLGVCRQTKHPARLIIDVTVKLLRVIPQNQCLGGD